MSDKPEPLRHLTGRGGLGLVIFHLARKKIEFALTPERSHLGDIWVSVQGSKYGIEVKTCRNAMKWQVKRSQIERVEFYVLVSMDTAECFVLTAPEIKSVIADAAPIYGDVHLIVRKQIPDETLNAWGRIDGVSFGRDRAPSLVHGSKASAGSYRHKKLVRKTLATGEIKTYIYERGVAITKPKRKPSENGKFFGWDA